MSDMEKKREQSMRLFEALGNVDPELLARSEKRRKVISPGRFGGLIAACLVLLVGGASLHSLQFSGKMGCNSSAPESSALSGGTHSLMADIQNSADNAMEEAIAEASPEGDATDRLKPESEQQDPEEMYKYSNSENGAENIADGSGSVILTQAEAGSSSGGEALEGDVQDYLDRAALEAAIKKEAARIRVFTSLSEAAAVERLGEYVPQELTGEYHFVEAALFEPEQEEDSGHLVIFLEKNGSEIIYTVGSSEPAQEQILLYDDGVWVSARGDASKEELIELLPVR